MIYADQWKALSSRIRGLMQAGQLHAQYLAVQSSDTYNRGRRLHEQSQRVLSALRSFRDSFHQSLPPVALAAIHDFMERSGALITNTPSAPNAQQECVWAALVSLAAFETEMSFILSDVQESIRARSERAFSHLQRSIVVDIEFRKKWQKAFDDRETACEKLGAVHLLLHGIWAFKVDATGARTDLVYQEPADDLINNIQRYADGIVLTEWKKVSPEGLSGQQFEEALEKALEKARGQARLYAQGALAGMELTNYRYIVVVSRDEVKVPGDLSEGGVVYRHINVSVAPRTPSRAR